MTVNINSKQDLDDFKAYIIAEKNFSEHTAKAYCSDILSFLVWMDEQPMDVNKSFYLKQTTNTSRCRIDHFAYKVDINTLDKSEVDHLELNEIGRAVIVTSKELFFDAYKDNKPTGAFILIDPITNNTSCVGMILGPVAEEKLHSDDALPTLDLPKLGIAPEHYEAIDKAVKELSRQGIEVRVRR